MPITFANKPGIVAYLTAGDPDLATTRDIALAAIDNGADVIELGVPFSDPLADGPVIQRASERAVARGTRLSDVLAWRRSCARRGRPCGLVLFSYLNPVVRMGMKAFCAAAKDAGADGVLLTDMIVEEAAEYLAEMQANDLAPIFLAAPTSPDARLKAIAEASKGFVYAISRVGITGTQDKVASDAPELVARLRQVHDAAHRGGLRHLERRACAGGGRVRRRGHHRQRAGGADRKDVTRRRAAGGRRVHSQFAVGPIGFRSERGAWQWISRTGGRRSTSWTSRSSR